jgi:hypothetical protein
MLAGRTRPNAHGQAHALLLKWLYFGLQITFFYNYWPQKSFSFTKFLLNPNLSNINAIGVWCSLVQRALAHFQTFLLLQKIAEILDLIEKLKIADLSPQPDHFF